MNVYCRLVSEQGALQWIASTGWSMNTAGESAIFNTDDIANSELPLSLSMANIVFGWLPHLVNTSHSSLACLLTRHKKQVSPKVFRKLWEDLRPLLSFTWPRYTLNFRRRDRRGKSDANPRQIGFLVAERKSGRKNVDIRLEDFALEESPREPRASFQLSGNAWLPTEGTLMRLCMAEGHAQD